MSLEKRNEMLRERLFSLKDEIEFKKAFVIQFLASVEAADYEGNVKRDWIGHGPECEGAIFVANEAWDEWVRTIGAVPKGKGLL